MKNENGMNKNGVGYLNSATFTTIIGLSHFYLRGSAKVVLPGVCLSVLLPTSRKN